MKATDRRADRQLLNDVCLARFNKGTKERSKSQIIHY